MIQTVTFLDTRISGLMTGMVMETQIILVKVLWMRTGTILVAAGLMNMDPVTILPRKSLIVMVILFPGQRQGKTPGRIPTVIQKSVPLRINMVRTGISLRVRRPVLMVEPQHMVPTGKC